MIEFSPDQLVVLDAFCSWLASGKKRLTVGGFAGTGKTTLVHRFIELLDGNVSVCAYTGKAAYVLRSKGISEASTIHKLIYVPITMCMVCSREKDLCECPYSTPTSVVFTLAPLLRDKFVIVDEASMVNGEIMKDLESFDVRIVYIGDHGQLQPIGSDPGIMADPDVRLEQIHRQAAGSPIIEFAHHVRQGNAPQTFGANAIVHRGLPSDLLSFDMILCGYNSTRVAVNSRVRSMRGFTSRLPEVGERVICLQNNRDFGVFNGMLGTVTKVEDQRIARFGDALISVEDDLGEVYPNLPFLPEQFGREQKMDYRKAEATLWDWGYCATVHKAQGSEWKRVAVLEQISSSWSSSRWRYTAATRASEHLSYCLSSRR